MLIAIIVLSILLVLSLITIVGIGINDSWSSQEWFGTLTFIFCLPLWVIIKIIINSQDDRQH
jgi:hypothetical protein